MPPPRNRSILRQVALGGLTLGLMACAGPQRLERLISQPGACNDVLTKCQALVEAQDNQIKQLKKDQGKLLDELADAEKEPLLPGWAEATIYVLIGLTLGIIIH